MKRRVIAPPPLTSLLDVLFILVFASVVHASASGAGAPAAPQATPPPPEPPAAFSELRARALVELVANLDGRQTAIARVTRDGVLARIELAERTIDLGIPLVERVADETIGLRYLRDLQVCRLVQLRLGVPDLSRHLVVIAPEAPRADLPVALVEGLRDEPLECAGIATVVYP